MRRPLHHHTATKVAILNHGNLGNRLRPYPQQREIEHQYCDILNDFKNTATKVAYIYNANWNNCDSGRQKMEWKKWFLKHCDEGRIHLQRKLNQLRPRSTENGMKNKCCLKLCDKGRIHLQRKLKQLPPWSSEKGTKNKWFLKHCDQGRIHLHSKLK